MERLQKSLCPPSHFDGPGKSRRPRTATPAPRVVRLNTKAERCLKAHWVLTVVCFKYSTLHAPGITRLLKPGPRARPSLF